MQSLFIDTNIQYDLDLSLFPGINDPGVCSQPALLIARSPKTMSLTPTFSFNNNNNVISVCQNNAAELDSDDLYSFIDSFDLINTDLTSGLADTGDLDRLMNDILESASFDPEGCGVVQAARKDCCVSSAYQCLFSGPTPAASETNNHNSSVCDLRQGNHCVSPIDAYWNKEGRAGGRGGPVFVGRGVNRPGGGVRGQCCQSPTDCLCTEHFLDSSLITELLELNNQPDSKKKKHGDNSRKRACYQSDLCGDNSSKRACNQSDLYDENSNSTVNDKTPSLSFDLPCNINNKEMIFTRYS